MQVSDILRLIIISLSEGLIGSRLGVGYGIVPALMFLLQKK
jgi:hypothetical protein